MHYDVFSSIEPSMTCLQCVGVGMRFWRSRSKNQTHAFANDSSEAAEDLWQEGMLPAVSGAFPTSRNRFRNDMAIVSTMHATIYYTKAP